MKVKLFDIDSVEITNYLINYGSNDLAVKPDHQSTDLCPSSPLSGDWGAAESSAQLCQFYKIAIAIYLQSPTIAMVFANHLVRS